MTRIRPARISRPAALARTLGWALVFLAVAEVAIRVAFPLPANPRTPPGRLAAYFDYGRSVESKLRREIGSDDAQASPVARAGWIDLECRKRILAQPGKRLVSFYGMSFSNDAAQALSSVDTRFQVMTFAGPAAPPNHSFHCIEEQRAAAAAPGGADQSQVQVFAILASSVKGLLSMSGATVGFERPAAYTYPRYRLHDGRLVATEPPIRSVQDWREALASPDRLAQVERTFAAHDRFFDPLMFTAHPSDQLATARLMRRAWAQRQIRALAQSVAGPEGFHDDPDIGPVLQTMVTQFAAHARSAGKRPVVLLIQDGRSGRSLSTLLAPTLDAAGIPWLSTAEVAPTTEPVHFLPDGHLTPEANRRLALQLVPLLSPADAYWAARP